MTVYRNESSVIVINIVLFWLIYLKYKKFSELE